MADPSAQSVASAVKPNPPVSSPPPAPPTQSVSGTLTGAGVGGAMAIIWGWHLHMQYGVEMPNEVTAAFASAFTVSFSIIGNIIDCIRWRREMREWNRLNAKFLEWLATQQPST